jgi:ABC-type Fe3+-hydroxamate transport system substrate-binding protein
MGDDSNGYEAPTRRDYMKYGGTVVGGSLLAGCAGQTDSESSATSTDTKTNSTPEDTETATPDQSYSVTMSPMGEVEFDKVPQEVVTYDDQWADILVSLGQQDRLVAHGRPGNMITDFYDQLPGVSFDTEGVAKLGDNISLETFFELDADLHHLDPIRLASWEGFDESDVETLREDIGPLFANRYSARRNYTGGEPYQYYTIWELSEKFAQVYQVPERASKLRAVYQEMVSDIQSELPPKEERPRVALAVHYQGTFYGQPGPMAPGFARAHTRPLEPRDAFADYPQYQTVGATYDMETMLEVDPDVFIQMLGIQFSDRIGSLKNPDEGSVKSEVTAFREGNVYNGGTNYQGPLYTLFQTEMTAKQIYPDLFGEWNGLDAEIPEEERLFDRQRVADIINGDT